MTTTLGLQEYLVVTFMVGLEYKFKEMESLTRKIENGGKIKDALRYTMLSNPDDYTTNYFQVVESLQEKGYNISDVKNTWNNTSTPYRGLNVNIKTPDGYIFELQFHTPDSFSVKQVEMHGLYEKYRVLNRNSKEADKLNTRMFELSSKLIKPKGVATIR